MLGEERGRRERGESVFFPWILEKKNYKYIMFCIILIHIKRRERVRSREEGKRQERSRERIVILYLFCIIFCIYFVSEIQRIIFCIYFALYFLFILFQLYTKYNEYNRIHPLFDLIQIHLTMRMNAYFICTNINTKNIKIQNTIFRIQLK